MKRCPALHCKTLEGAPTPPQRERGAPRCAALCCAVLGCAAACAHRSRQGAPQWRAAERRAPQRPIRSKGQSPAALRSRGSGGASLQKEKMGRIERNEGLEVSYCKGGSPWEATMGLVSEIRLPTGKADESRAFVPFWKEEGKWLILNTGRFQRLPPEPHCSCCCNMTSKREMHSGITQVSARSDLKLHPFFMCYIINTTIIIAAASEKVSMFRIFGNFTEGSVFKKKKKKTSVSFQA